MSVKVRELIQEPPHYLDRNIRFSFSRCDINNWCITTLQKNELERFYKTLGKFENLSWGTVRQMPREKGISLDTKSGNVHSLLHSKMSECSSFGHFRVNGSDVPTRIFIGLNGDLAYILLVDRTGALQEH